MNNTINTNTSIEQQPTTPTPEASGDQGGARTFTQEDVNRIVGERLARAKQDADTTRREADLTARENRLTCREYLSAEKLPAELADILPTTDVETFKSSVGKLVELFQKMELTSTTADTIKIDLAAPLGGNSRSGPTVADAFKPPKI